MVGSGEFSTVGELAEQNGCEFVMSGEEIKPRWRDESVETAKMLRVEANAGRNRP